MKKLAIGAAGVNSTIARLKDMGLNPIELERGSTGFKIWKKIKIKRVRVPDIMCLNTGLRFESRGKTKPEISMSHSKNDPKRAWDAGMRDDDFISIVVFEPGDSPVDLKQISPVHFIGVKALRKAFADEQASFTQPKGVEEGSEIRVVWPCAIAHQKSTVLTVDSERITLHPVTTPSNQSIKLIRQKGRITLIPQVGAGDTVEANQIVASVVPVKRTIPWCRSVDETYFLDKLASVNPSERYAAAKALRYRGYGTAEPLLNSRMNDPDEDIYVQLEAAAALAAHDDPNGWKFIENKLRSPVMAIPLETQLEAVIVVSEISKDLSEPLLIEVLHDANRNEELRAGAAWALGQCASVTSAAALVNVFDSSSLEVKVEAARALLRIAGTQVPVLVDLLRNSDAAKRDGIAWALARTGKFSPADVIAGADDNLRRWMSYIIGYGKNSFIHAEVEAICTLDPEVYFAASVLWQILASWINGLNEY